MNRFAIAILLAIFSGELLQTTQAQSLTAVYAFAKGPTNPRGNLALGPDGSFYGTTESGGQSGEGTVFRVTTNGDLTTLASFSGYTTGSEPYAGLTLGPDGNFYGTTLGGGTNILVSGTNNTGTVFRVTTNGAVTTIVNFTGANGGHPQSKLLLGPGGDLYGTTAYGGAGGDGTVFRVTTNGVLTTLASFNGTNGATPEAGLALGWDGNLYGTTVYGGGTNNLGTIFRVTTNGTLTPLFAFSGTNGAWPYGQLICGTDGKLYGTAAFGGNPNGDFSGGTVFQITTNGALTTLVYFSAFAGTNGENSYGQLIQGADGNFYGATAIGGANGSGTIFQVTTNNTAAQLAAAYGPQFQYQLTANPVGVVYLEYTTNNWTDVAFTLYLNGSLTKLYDFPPLANATNSTGADTQSGLTLGPDGSFYLASYKGGANGYGVVDRVTTNGIITPLASFAGDTGVDPYGGLIQGPDGSLYGTTQSGGTDNYGALFRLSLAGDFTILVNFDYWTNGANPYTGLTLGPDGNLYGTATGGGTNLVQIGPNTYNSVSDGTVFRITTNGVFTPLAYFNGTNGANPYGNLALAGDGNFYGTTTAGGASNSGTIFQVTTNGVLTALVSFTGANGAKPLASLTVGQDGNLYGTTSAGGGSNDGTVFEVSTQGILNTLVNFTGPNGSGSEAPLLWGPDGYFYGVTVGGGSNSRGTLFKVTPGGTLTTLVNFAQTNGSSPSGRLLFGPDGNLYGTTSSGGTAFDGTVFRLTTNGTFTTLANFTSASGYWPFGGLTLVTNGDFIRLYGAAFNGGSGGGGTIYQVNLTTYYAVPENTPSQLNPLTNDVLWTTGGSLRLAGASSTNGTATINGDTLLVLPATNFTGSATLAYTFTDGSGQTNTSLIVLTVTNIPPVATPDAARVGENSGENVLAPLANDLVETPGGTLGLLSVSTTNGSVMISGTNVVFSPATNFIGTVTVNYVVTDNIGGTNGSYITVQVTNAPPTANAQSVLTAENAAASITLTGADPNHLPLTFAIATGPANGTLSGFDPGTGAVTYQPAPDYSGPDSFTFQVNDGQAGSAPATVSITVTATVITNTPPLANPDFYRVTENTTNIFNPLANDEIQTAGGVLSLASLNPTNGTAAISGTNVVFTPFTNFTGTATVGYTITDGLGGTAASVITVTVTNIPPAAVPDGYAVAENSTNTFEPLTNDVLRTPGGTLQLSAVSPTNGTAAIVDGTNLVFSPTRGFVGTATIGYTITDGIGGTNLSLVTVAVTNPPPVANPQSVTTLFNLPVAITLSGSDPNDYPLTFSLTIQPAHGTVSGLDSDTGALTYTPGTNFSGPDSFAFVVNNGISTSAPATVTVTVASPVTADLAVFDSGPATGVAGSNLVYTITVTNAGPATASNVVASDLLPPSFTLAAIPPGATYTNGLVTWPAIPALAAGASTNYPLVVQPTTGGVFTNISSAVSETADPNPTNNSGDMPGSRVVTEVLGAAQFSLSGGATVFNPQTGLYEETVTVQNTGSNTIAGFWLYVALQTPNVQLWNATGTNDGRPYVQYGLPLNPAGAASLILKFFDPARTPITNTLQVVAIAPSSVGNAGTNGSVPVNAVFTDTQHAGMRLVIEFASVPGRTYAILYSSDLENWRIATPSLTAHANITQWIDDGPPETISAPLSTTNRFYRVIQY